MSRNLGWRDALVALCAFGAFGIAILDANEWTWRVCVAITMVFVVLFLCYEIAPAAPASGSTKKEA